MLQLQVLKNNFWLLTADNVDALTVLIYFRKGVGSIYADNIGSVRQRVAKLLAVKVGVLKEESADSTVLAKACERAFGPSLRQPRSNHLSKFEGQQL